MKNILVLLSIIFVSTQFASAQVEELAPDVQVQEISSEPIESRAVIVADTDVTNVIVAEDDGVLSGTFNLVGKMGVQRGINYGIIAQTEDYEIVDVFSLGQDEVVSEGELKVLEFSYKIPAHLSGEVTFYLKAETENGLPLSIQELAKKTFPNKIAPFTCLVNEESTDFTCQSENADTLTVAYTKGSLFSKSVKTEKLEVVKEVKVSPELPVGRYRAVIISESGYLVLLTVRTPGSYGSIQNFVLSEREGEVGLFGVAPVFASPANGLTASISLMDSKGEICGQADVEVKNLVVEFFLEPFCATGQATLQLKDAQGASLDSQSTNFVYNQYKEPEIVEEVVPSEERSASSNNSFKYLMIIIIFTLIGVIIWFIALRKKEVLPTLVLLAIIFGVSVNVTEAVTLSELQYEAPAHGNGEIGYQVFSSITPNKSDYVAGETMTITASTMVNTDAGLPVHSLDNANVAYNAGPAWDNPVHAGGPVLVNPAPMTQGRYLSSGPYVGSANVTVPALSIGGHYLRMRMGFQVSGHGPKVIEGNMTFNIINPVCNLGCEGFVRHRPNAFTAYDDFTCPAGTRLEVSNGTWSGGSCSGMYTGSFPNIRCIADAACSIPTPTATLTISPSSATFGTNINFTLSSTNAASCEVVENPGNTVIVPRSANLTSHSVGSVTGVGTWTYSTRCWSGPNGTGSVSATDTDVLNITAPAASVGLNFSS